MRTRFRRKRASAKWTFADSQTLEVDASTPSPFQAFAWLYPPARAQFLMNTRNRDRLGFRGAHLWLDFFLYNSGGPEAMPDVDFGVFKTTIAAVGDQPDLTPMLGQWKQPATPATLTSWEEDDDDGTNPFLWQHHIKGMSPPNAIVNAVPGLSTANDASFIANQAVNMRAGDSDHIVYACRKFFVTQEWQPDVVIRSRRTLMKGEGIVLCMQVVTAPAGSMRVYCNTHFRSLTV